MEKPKKRYIIRTYTQGSAPAVQEISRNVPTITGNDLTETVFRNRRQFIFFVEEDLRTVILRKLTAYMRPVPIVRHLQPILLSEAIRKRPATYCNLRQVSVANADFAKLCQPLPSYAKFAKNGFSVFKSQIRRKTANSQH